MSTSETELAVLRPVKADISIIIPTLAAASRQVQLERAICSIQAASLQPVQVIVCVNGNRWEPGVLAGLAKMAGVEVHRLPEPSLPRAITYGRSCVETEFFGFLDDDDELLPNALDARLRVLRSCPDSDLVACNGIRCTAAGETQMLQDLAAVPGDPLKALFERNWLPSCGALYRSATVGSAYFTNIHPYAEWTWLAYRLGLEGKRVAVLDQPTFVVNDTPGSLSKSTAYRSAYLDLYRRMLACDPPPVIRKILRRRVTDALHDLSDDRLAAGDLAKAMHLHLQCLVQPGGFRYLSYTRHVLAAWLMGKNR